MKTILILSFLIVLTSCNSSDKGVPFISKRINLMNEVTGVGSNDISVKINDSDFEFQDEIASTIIRSGAGETSSSVKVDVIDNTDNSILATKDFSISPTTSTTDLLYSIIIGGTKADISIGLLDDNNLPSATASLSQYRIIYMGEGMERRDIYTQNILGTCNITDNSQPLATKNADLGAGDIIDFYSTNQDRVICITAVGGTSIDAFNLESFITGKRQTIVIKADDSFTSYDRSL